MNPTDRVSVLESLLQRVQANARGRVPGPVAASATAAAPPAAPLPAAAAAPVPAAAKAPAKAEPITRPPPSDGFLHLDDEEDVREDEPTIPPAALGEPPRVVAPAPRAMTPLSFDDEEEVTEVRKVYGGDDGPQITTAEADIVLDVDFDDVQLIDEPTTTGDADSAEALAIEQAHAEQARQAEAALKKEEEEKEAAWRKATEEEMAKRNAEAQAAKAAEEAAPISTRQPVPKDEVREMDFGDLGGVEDEEPPESGEVASQRKPTIDPAVAALADWREEETHDGPAPPDVLHGTEPPPTAQGGSAEVRLRAPFLEAEVEPQVIRRAGAVAVDVVSFVEAARGPAAGSFGELLGASLSLGD